MHFGWFSYELMIYWRTNTGDVTINNFCFFPLRTEFPVFWEFLGIPRKVRESHWFSELEFLGIPRNSKSCWL